MVFCIVGVGCAGCGLVNFCACIKNAGLHSKHTTGQVALSRLCCVHHQLPRVCGLRWAIASRLRSCGGRVAGWRAARARFTLARRAAAGGGARRARANLTDPVPGTKNARAEAPQSAPERRRDPPARGCGAGYGVCGLRRSRGLTRRSPQAARQGARTRWRSRRC